MRSVVVVLPASMCAMMPMLRVRSSGACLAIVRSPRFQTETSNRQLNWPLPTVNCQLPTVVSKGLVRFRHAVRVFALLDGATTKVGGVEQLVGQLLLHRLAVAPRAREADQPADAEREAAVRIDFNRNLVVRAADAARLHFEGRLDVV